MTADYADFADGVRVAGPKVETPTALLSSVLIRAIRGSLSVPILVFLAACSSASAQTATIAMCQIVCLDGDREGNFVRIENALREAAAAGADIACFPECAILGWVNPDAHARAYPIPGPDTDRLCELARQYKVHLCVGLDEKDGTNLYDAAVLIDDAGNLLLKHRKMHNLPDVVGLMVPPYADGTDIMVAETRFGRIGVLICADTFIDGNLRRMAALKPALVLVPYGWVADEGAWPKHGEGLANVVRRAAEVTGAPVVGTDSIGQVSHGAWTGKYYGGLSVAYSPDGRRLALAADRDRDVEIVAVPLTPNAEEGTAGSH